MNMSLSRIPRELKECILEKIATYKIRIAFAKALLGYYIRQNMGTCDECGMYKRLYIEDRCADAILGHGSCCSIYLCTKCKHSLPLECGHTISKKEYTPKDRDYYIGYYCHMQHCKECDRPVIVSREWWGLSPSEWMHRY